MMQVQVLRYSLAYSIHLIDVSKHTVLSVMRHIVMVGSVKNKIKQSKIYHTLLVAGDIVLSRGRRQKIKMMK